MLVKRICLILLNLGLKPFYSPEMNLELVEICKGILVNLFVGIDREGNSALHAAAKFGEDKCGRGAAHQMKWGVFGSSFCDQMVKHDEKGHRAGEGADGVITAVYKLNLDCLQCVRQIQKSLQRTQGVQSVDVDIESSEIKVKGRFDAKEIHEQIVKISKRKVEMVTLQPKNKVDSSISQKKGAEEKKEAKELSLKKDIKEPISSTTILKVHMHCSKCEYDLKRKILKLKGVYSVKSDTKAQTLAVEGTIDPPKLVEYIHKKFHKHAEIVTLKREKKQQEGKKEKVTEKETDVKIIESKNITVASEENKLELKVKESSTTAAPYIVHNVYAPQLFSDENPNACSIQ